MLRNDYLNLPDNWEDVLEQMMLSRAGSPDNRANRIYICSPCRSDSAEGIRRNMKAARVYMFYTYIHFASIPVAPHAYLPILLNDLFEEERALALSLGLQFVENCDKLFVCGDQLSNGMYGEIAEAVKRKIPVLVFDRQVFKGVQNFFALGGFSADAAQFEDSGLHPALRWGADRLAPFWEVKHIA